jgi:thermostable 8-oxoguanine DNA glycosylase
MIVHIKVGVAKENGKWVGRWSPQESEVILPNEILANRREELERKMDKALRLAFPKASYIVQHREATDAQHAS